MLPKFKNFIRSYLISDQSLILSLYHNFTAWFWALAFGLPVRGMHVIAVTGTNGKTSCCNLLHQAYTKLGLKTSMLSTVNYAVNNELFDNKQKMSTLPAFKLNRLLRKMSKAGSQVLIIEATSHAAFQGRLNGIKFDQLIFTNLGQDHLEYHGSFEDYKKAKLSYVSKLKSKSAFIYNADDSYAGEFVCKIPSGIKTNSFGFSSSANACISNLKESLESTRFDCNVHKARFSLHTRLLGRYNVLNVAAVILSLREYGFEMAEIQNIIKHLRPVPGRLDVVINDLKTFIFDYAHDTESLENLLKFVAQHKEGDLWLLFGCTGGNRDKLKRPKMGLVAEKYANKIILTNDDPYNEDPDAIIADIMVGIQNHSEVMQIVDRSDAIKHALENMQNKDVLVLAGKGGEKVIAIGDELICFDEKQIVLDFFNDSI